MTEKSDIDIANFKLIQCFRCRIVLLWRKDTLIFFHVSSFFFCFTYKNNLIREIDPKKKVQFTL